MRYHLDDLESDFSRFHRIDDMWAMPGPRFLRFAWRIAAYGGMMTRRVEAQNEEPAEPAAEPTPRRAPARSSAQVDNLAPKGAKLVSAAELAFLHPGIVELRRAPKAE